ncbi:MAG: amino acid adenylation domain-containing protein [Candidatus Omnitrophota bacterium]
MIDKTSIKDMYFLSPMQEGMLFHYLMDKTSPAYFEQTSYRVKGELNLALFEQAFNRIIERHDVLRTVFVHEKVQRPVQVVLKQRKKSIDYHDISHLAADEQEPWIQAFKRRDKARGFELEKDTLIRMAILKISANRYEIIWSFHHIIMDGWCVTILIKELLLTYYGLAQGKPVHLPPAAPYKNYIKWLEKQNKEAGIAYWQHYLEDYENQATIPQTQNTPEKNEYKPETHRFILNRAWSKKLVAISNEHNVTMSTMVQTLWGILLQKYNNTDDVLFGAIVSGRPATLPNVETIVGLFINAVPVRVKAEPGDTFLGLLKRMNAQMIQSRAYEFAPLAEIQARSALKRELINSLFIFENYPVDREIEKTGQGSQSFFSVESVDVFEQTTYDLNIVVNFVEELIVDLKYNAAVYDRDRIRHVEKHLGRIIEQIVERISEQALGLIGDIRLDDLEIITRDEKQHILLEFNHKKAAYPPLKAHELFEKQEAENPDRAAVVYENSVLSYGQVNRDVNRLARLFSDYGIGENHIVALLLDRSPRLFEIIMALWKLGAAYIPMETDYPAQRVNEILKNSETRFLITGSEYVHPETEHTFLGHVTIIKPDQEQAAIARQCDSNVDIHTPFNHLAYILYTSGSTGKPKGAMVEHIGSMNHMHGKIRDTEMTAQSVMVQNGPQTFDVCIWQFFAPLTLGSRTVMYSHALLLEPDRFIDRLILDQITILEVVPSYLNVLLDFFEKRRLTSLPLKYLLPTGEELKPLLVKRWFKLFPNINVINTYGPTECSDDVAHYMMDRMPEDDIIPLGSPLPNVNMYVVDRHMKLCPVGVKGEICVAGIAVGRGYLKDEERTKKVFMEDPFAPERGVRLYKMGDMGCWRPDGNLLFFGRKDYQVKIRGHLVECGEIENRLLDMPSVKEAVVIDREDTKGHKYLSAYLVGDSASNPLNLNEVKAQLAIHLPDYMIPAYFMEVERIPLTPNGKIDRKALPLPQTSMGGSSSVYDEPRDEIEKTLAEIWSKLLGVPNPGINDNFFDCGGHSLNGMTLVSRIHKQLNVEIPIKELFNRPTIAEMADFIRNAGKQTCAAIETAEKRDYYPLSSAQLRLAILDNLEEKSTAYNIPFVMELVGDLDMVRLENAFKGLIRRHEPLRSTIHVIDGTPVQIVHEAVEFQMEQFTVDATLDQKPMINALIHESFIRPFDLSCAPLMRAGVIRTKDMKHIVMLDIHHIACDGYAFDIIVKDLSGLYAGEKLPELKVRYKDFVLWQLGMLKSEQFKEKEAYWLTKFSGEIPVLNLSTDYPRPPVRSFEGTDLTFTIDRELSQRIKELAAKEGDTLYMTLLAAYSVLLSKYSGQDDIIVGSPSAGRPHADLHGIMGMFVNTLVMRNYPEGEKTFTQFLNEVKADALNAYQHQDYQFESLVARLDLTRDLSRNPLFDTLFAVQNMDVGGVTLPGLQIKEYDSETRTAKFDITLYAYEVGPDLVFKFNYCTKLFKPETIERMRRHLIHILIHLSNQTVASTLKLHEIRMLSEIEERALLVELNQTDADYPRDLTIHELFDQQVEKAPDHLAIIGKEQITYNEFNAQSNRLADALKEKGVQTDSIIAIKVERSLEMMIGIMGILKAGGAYLPIDPQAPEDRVNYMLADSGARLVLATEVTEYTEKGVIEVKKGPAGAHMGAPRHREIHVGADLRVCPALPAAGHRPPTTSLAYVIYTSGTTGKPKGAIIEHRSLVNRLHWMQRQYPIGESDTILQKNTYTFDVSVWEILWWSIAGARLCLLPPGGEKDPEIIVRTIERHKVTVMHFVPSMFGAFLDYISSTGNTQPLACLTQIITSGEALLPDHVQRFNRLLGNAYGTRLANLYGPTEATIDVSYFNTPKSGEIEIIPIGKPIDNIRLYILDKYFHVQPVQTTGELYIAGVGLARGYLNNPELSAEKFIVGPFRFPVYKTGDLARWLPDGNIEYLGRIDQQVKVRGFRIEPDEIKNHLLSHEAITDAVVVAKQGKDNSKHLVGYVVSSTDIESSQLKAYLSHRLPDYMIPAYIIRIPVIPLSANGKIDRKQLPEPDMTRTETTVPPENPMEETLVAIWKEVLESEKIGVTDNFFTIGGDSIKAIRLVSLINKQLETSIKLIDLFNHNSVRALSRILKRGIIDEDRHDVEQVIQEIEAFKTKIIPKDIKEFQDIEEILPMSDIEKGMIFHAYQNPDEAVYHDQFVYERKFSEFNPDVFKRALDLMVEKHPILRTSFSIDQYDEFVHFIHRPMPAVYKHVDLKHLDRKAQEDYIRNYMEEDRKYRWNIALPPLCRMVTFDLGNDIIGAVWTFHHAIIDGWSNASLMTELNNTYLQLKKDENYRPEKLSISYKDFIIHEMVEKRKTANIDFWRSELEDYKRLPFPGAAQGQTSEIVDFLPPPFMASDSRLHDAVKYYNVSLKTLCFAAYLYMLGMLTHDNDVVAGLVSNNRPEVLDGDKLIGCFLNTLPFRFRIPDQVTCETYIHAVDRKLLSLKSYDKMTFYEIVRVMGDRNHGGNQIYDTFFNYIDFHVYGQVVEETVQSLDKELLVSGYGKTNTLFDFNVQRYFSGILVQLRFSTSVLDLAMAQKLHGYFETALSLFVSQPHAMLQKETVMSDQEKQELLDRFNRSSDEPMNDITIRDLFDKQVEETPDSIAVVFSPLQITYRELNEQSDRLAHSLWEKGVRSDTIVAIKMERSVEMIIAIFGIFKSGGAYLPIDPEFPKNRTDYLLKDSGVALLLLSNNEDVEEREIHVGADPRVCPGAHMGAPLQRIIHVGADPRVCPGAHMGAPLQRIIHVGADPCVCPSAPPVTSLAYVIYTSGTTGKSKGVLIEHKNLVNYVNWFRNKVELTSDDQSILTSSYAFDLGYTSIYPALLSGCRLHIVPRETYLSSEDLLDYMVRHRVTYIKVTPSLLSAILESSRFSSESLRYLRLLVLGGEAIKVNDVKRIHDSVRSLRIMNHYGPTETTIGCVAQLIDPDQFELFMQRPVIGSPITNMNVLILDHASDLLPVGIAGQLCVSGTGVGRGYLNRPELTLEKFAGCRLPVAGFLNRTQNPNKSFCGGERGAVFSKRAPLYKTGDMARWMETGAIEFLGRIDTQVKIRGYRVELGEIENRLKANKRISQAAVVDWVSPDGDKYLCAYIVSEKEEDIAGLREYLAEELPDYMIPTHFISLERIPLTLNGKIDRKQLPVPQQRNDSSYVAPRNACDAKLADIWSLILGIDRNAISIRQNFFELGGHSLKAIVLVSKIHQAFDVVVPVSKIFGLSTIEKLSDHILGAGKHSYSAIEPVEKKEYYPLSFAQKRLYVTHMMNETNLSYNIFNIFQFQGSMDRNLWEQAFNRLIHRHESLRTSFKTVQGKAVQQVHDTVNFAIEYYGDREHAGLDAFLEISRRFRRPFHLSQAPLIRVGMAQSGEETFVLMIDIHHIVSDGVSNEILRREISKLCRGENLTPLKIQYKDFSEWQNTLMTSGYLDRQRDYWLRVFGNGNLPEQNLPLDFPRSTSREVEIGDHISFYIETEVYETVQRAMANAQVTLSMFLLAIYNTLLHRYTRSEDVVIGLVIAGRTHIDLEQVIGMFVNMLPLRNYPEKNKPFSQFLQEVKTSSLAAFENQDFPYDELVALLGLQGETGKNALFDVTFNFNTGSDLHETSRETGNAPSNENDYAKFDITLYATEMKNCVELTLRYSTRIFKCATIETFKNCYMEILTQVLNNMDIPLNDISFSNEFLASKTKSNLDQDSDFLI